MRLINKDSCMYGIYKAKLIQDENVVRAYIPGVSNIMHITDKIENTNVVVLDTNEVDINDEKNKLILYEKNIKSLPIVQWCAYNTQSTELQNLSDPAWVMFEAGDVKRPVVLSYDVIGGTGTGSGLFGVDGGDAQTNAKKVFYLYDALGVPKVNISGILGNYTVECKIDPTTIEGIYDEPYTLGPKKQAANSNLDSYTLNTLFPLYARTGVSIHKPTFKATDGKYYPGIAINSATGEGAKKLIDYANSKNAPWYSIELQLTFNLTYVGTKNVVQYNYMTQQWNKPEASPSAAAITFGQRYEHGGISPYAKGILNSAKRESAAAEWYSQMTDWTSNLNYGYSLIKAAGYGPPTQASNFNQSAWDSANAQIKFNTTNGGTFDTSLIKGYCYPLSSKHTADPTSGGRAFGASRDNGNRAHAGIDLIVAPGVEVIACTSGEVSYISYNFFAGTDAIVIKNNDGTWMTYGECKPLDGISIGTKVTKGQIIGTIIANNSKGTSMLHFEAYKGDSTGNVLTSNGTYKHVPQKNYKRRSDLCDPTFVKDLPLVGGRVT